MASYTGVLTITATMNPLLLKCLLLTSVFFETRTYVPIAMSGYFHGSITQKAQLSYGNLSPGNPSPQTLPFLEKS